MATYTGMDYWLELDFEELLEHRKDVEKLVKERDRNG